LRNIGGEERFMVTRQNLKIAPDAKIFSPGNLKSTADHIGFKKSIDYFIQNEYTLRYSGGMVPDIF
jgi:sedoheptulose-bisphosphatase